MNTSFSEFLCFLVAAPDLLADHSDRGEEVPHEQNEEAEAAHRNLSVMWRNRRWVSRMAWNRHHFLWSWHSSQDRMNRYSKHWSVVKQQNWTTWEYGPAILYSLGAEPSWRETRCWRAARTARQNTIHGPIQCERGGNHWLSSSNFKHSTFCQFPRLYFPSWAPMEQKINHPKTLSRSSTTQHS